MSEIKVLSKEVAELIAAGEVIERPGSVIKELVENSIDSGASSITVEIKNGGVTYMRVTDNGCGIPPAEVPIAFLRHATSKIESESDLDSIFTLGFRGEALASIAAVARVEMLTKRQCDDYGTRYVIEGTEEKLCESSGCPDGTTIVIRDIFYNVPARMKFLKSDVSEANNVATIVKRIALSHPDIAFRFIRDNKQELCTSGAGDLYSAVYSVFGKQFAASMLPVDYKYENVKVTGFTVKPTFAKANRSFQTYFVNGRYVKSLVLLTAMDEAYKNSIMTGKFPACVLNIEIAPGTVDVNVHPAKIEVRFSDENAIRSAVVFAVKNALLSEDTPNSFQFREKAKPSYLDPPPVVSPLAVQTTFTFNSEGTAYKVVRKEDQSIAENSWNNTYTPNSDTQKKDELAISEAVKPDAFQSSECKVDEPYTQPAREFRYINENSFEKRAPIEEKSENEVTPIKYIGEAFANFVIIEVDNDLFLIDKHAAHERIIFERIKNQPKALCCQLLMLSEEILLTDEQYAALLENEHELSDMGFSLQFDKAPYVKVIGLPQIIENISPDDILPEIADNILNGGSCTEPSVIDDIYHSMSCKAAIKARDKTTPAELRALAEEVYNNEAIRYCPHGRPVMITISKYDIEKQFKRIV